MISSIEISEIIPTFVEAIERDEYDVALDLFRRIKARVRLIKAQLGRLNDYSHLDETMDKLETSLVHRLSMAKELQQEFLHLLVDMGVPIK